MCLGSEDQGALVSGAPEPSPGRGRCDRDADATARRTLAPVSATGQSWTPDATLWSALGPQVPSQGWRKPRTTSYPDAQVPRQLLGVLRPSLPKTLRHAGAAELPGVHRLPLHATQTLGRRAVLGAPGRAPSRLRLLLPLVPSRLALLLPVPSAPLPPPSGGCAGGSMRPAASTHFAENGGIRRRQSSSEPMSRRLSEPSPGPRSEASTPPTTSAPHRGQAEGPRGLGLGGRPSLPAAEPWSPARAVT